jgi:hypothetical protein
MSDLYAVRVALEQGLGAAEALSTWVTNHKPLALNITRRRTEAIRDGLRALARLEQSSKPCDRPHIEVEVDSGCRCHVVRMPPCSWCENGGEQS